MTALSTSSNRKLFLYIIKDLSFFATNKQFVKELYKAIVDVFKVFGLSSTNKKKFDIPLFKAEEDIDISLFEEGFSLLEIQQDDLITNEKKYISLKLEERLYILFRVYDQIKPYDKYNELLKSNINISFDGLLGILERQDSYYFEEDFDTSIEEILSQLMFLDRYKNISTLLNHHTKSLDLEYFIAAIHFYFPTNYFLEAEPNRVITTTVNITRYNPCFNKVIDIAFKFNNIQYYIDYVENFPYSKIEEGRGTYPKVYGWKILASYLGNSSGLEKNDYLEKYEEYFNFKKNDYFYEAIFDHLIGSHSPLSKKEVDESIFIFQKRLLTLDNTKPNKFFYLFWCFRRLFKNQKTFEDKVTLYADLIKDDLKIDIQIALTYYYYINDIKTSKDKFEKIQIELNKTDKFPRDLLIILGHCNLYSGNLEIAKNIYTKARDAFDGYDNSGFGYQFDKSLIEQNLNKELKEYIKNIRRNLWLGTD